MVKKIPAEGNRDDSSGLSSPVIRIKNLLIPQSRSAADVVYSRSRRMSIFFTGIAGAVNGCWLFSDFSQNPSIGNALRAGTVLLCLIAVYAARDNLSDRKRLLFNVAVTVMILLEIEARFHSSGSPFWSASVWSVYITMMAAFAFLFLGPPLYYFFVCAGVLVFYTVRTGCYLEIPGPQAHAVADVQFFTYVLSLLFFAVNIWWFHVRYRSCDQENKIKELHEISLIEANLRAEAEKKLVITRERERVSADFHDNLGGSLTDIQIFLMRRKRANPENSNWNELGKMIQSVSENMKSMIQDHRAVEYADTNFVLAIRSLLLRRYVTGGRRFLFQAEDRARQMLARDINDSIRQNLLKLIREILNNDVTFGAGDAVWEFMGHENTLILLFRTQTATSRRGASEFNVSAISDCCHEMGAVMKSIVNNDSLELEISLPV